MNRTFFFANILLIGMATAVNAQLHANGQTSENAPTQRSADRRANSISGRVADESGQPMSYAIVNVAGRGNGSVRRTTGVDDDGRFRIEDLPPGLYLISTLVRGYIPVADKGGPPFYRPGDSVNLVVRRGGVITGTVTNAAGEPLIHMPVTAILHRDPEGRPTHGQTAAISEYTDDRGVYRLFTLPPGSYLVAAACSFNGPYLWTDFAGDAPTYYPSSTIDSATEVLVRSGEEATGIDIQFRGDHGSAISGSVTGAPVTGSGPVGVTVFLQRATGESIEAQTYTRPRGNDLPFSFFGISDGEYYVTAQRFQSPNDDGAGSRPVRIKVAHQDVIGLQIAVLPFASVAGRVVLETPSINEKKIQCETKRAPSIEETLLRIRHDQKDAAQEQLLPGMIGNVLVSPGSKGDLLFQGLDPGHYRIETTMLDEAWYVRAVTLPRTGRPTTSPDAGRIGFAAKSGERLNGLTVLIAEGAASLRGRVTAETKGALLPDRLLIHLVPVDEDAADDTLRFAEAVVQGDGTFTMRNLAPGRYRLITRRASDEEANERSPVPLAWSSTPSRAKLRRDAEALNIIVDLKPCQRVADYELRYVVQE